MMDRQRLTLGSGRCVVCNQYCEKACFINDRTTRRCVCNNLDTPHDSGAVTSRLPLAPSRGAPQPIHSEREVGTAAVSERTCPLVPLDRDAPRICDPSATISRSAAAPVTAITFVSVPSSACAVSAPSSHLCSNAATQIDNEADRNVPIHASSERRARALHSS